LKYTWVSNFGQILTPNWYLNIHIRQTRVKGLKYEETIELSSELKKRFFFNLFSIRAMLSFSWWLKQTPKTQKVQYPILPFSIYEN